jgi:hypothetical protein
MKFYCPLCGVSLRVQLPVDPNWKVSCEKCGKTFQWKNEFVKPYCYACESEDVVAWIQTDIGCVFGCSEHAANVAEFWLLPMIKTSAVKASAHAREYDGSPSNNDGPLAAKAAKKSVGK